MTIRRISHSQEIPRAEERHLRSERFEREALRMQAVSQLNIANIWAGLFPVMWGIGTGSALMLRTAAPMVGSTITAPSLLMFVEPAAYFFDGPFQASTQ